MHCSSQIKFSLELVSGSEQKEFGGECKLRPPIDLAILKRCVKNSDVLLRCQAQKKRNPSCGLLMLIAAIFRTVCLQAKDELSLNFRQHLQSVLCLWLT